MRRTVSAVAAGARVADAFSVEELAMSRILEDCLQAMSGGQSSLDGILDRHPEARH